MLPRPWTGPNNSFIRGGARRGNGCFSALDTRELRIAKEFRLPLAIGPRSFRRVSWVRTALTLLLVALWLPSSSHSLLESAGFIHDWHAAHDGSPDGSHQHHDDDHDVADGHCLLSSHEVSAPAPQAVVTQLWVCLLACEWTPEFSEGYHPSGTEPPGAAPPELSHRWQFSSRTALPPRAPSFAS